MIFRPHYFLTLSLIWFDGNFAQCSHSSPLHTHTHPGHVKIKVTDLEFSWNKMCSIRRAILSGDRSCFLNSVNLICRCTDISKYFRESLGIGDNIWRMFLLSVWTNGTIYMNFDEKYSSNVLENQTRLQNSAYTTKKELVFPRTLLFEQISSGINQDILKILPDGVLKIVIWSCGFPTLLLCAFQKEKVDIRRFYCCSYFFLIGNDLGVIGVFSRELR